MTFRSNINKTQILASGEEAAFPLNNGPKWPWDSQIADKKEKLQGAAVDMSLSQLT